jgi:hypothetical protein
VFGDRVGVCVCRLLGGDGAGVVFGRAVRSIVFVDFDRQLNGKAGRIDNVIKDCAVLTAARQHNGHQQFGYLVGD